MVEETTFHHALDVEPDNCALRLVFADWLEEKGDPRAAGYRWMGEFGKWPFDWSQRHRVPSFRESVEPMPILDTFDWYLEDGGASWDVPLHCQLPSHFRALFKAQAGWLDYPTRRTADEALCQVIDLHQGLLSRRPSVTAWRPRAARVKALKF